MSESVRKHRSEAPEKLRFAVFTVSTSRYEKFRKGEGFVDVSGDLVQDLVGKANHSVSFRKLISDDKAMIEENMRHSLCDLSVDVVVFCGGTGVNPSDVTVESVLPFFEKVLPGFGEIFRRLSFDRIGSAAVLSRAIAGVAMKKIVFCIPGSPDAVRLCMEKLILLEVGHILKHVRE